jgi:hypothetical protein
MTVQRQYTLPNCNLKLEGLTTGDETDPMAPLTVVLNSECMFPGTTGALSGGREFLNALVKTVNDYAQSLLSGVPYPLPAEASETQPIALRPSDNHRHQLIAMVTDTQGEPTHQTVELNSVQLFDLMEAVDQLLADTQTLPDMTLQLSPLHRRYARPTEPASKRVFPAVTGVSALVASAVLLFMVPIPEFEPQRTEPEEQTQSELVEPEAGNPAATGTTPPDPVEDADTTAETGPVDAVEAGIALGRLSAAPVIDDDEALAALGTDLATVLEENLPEDVPFTSELVYRVAVSEAGDILGYKYENESALENVDNTPLPELTYIPVLDEAVAQEPVAQFLVTFAPDGDVTTEPIAPEDIAE